MVDCRKCRYADEIVMARSMTALRCRNPDASRWSGRLVGNPQPAHLPKIPVEAPVWCPERSKDA